MPLFGKRPNVRKLREKRDVPGLIEALQHQESEVRIEAVGALRSCDDDARFPALIRALDDPEVDVRVSAARALGRIGRRDASILEALRVALLDRQKGVADTARSSLVKLQAEDFLIRSLEDDSHSAAAGESITATLKAIGSEKAKEAIRSYRSRRKAAREPAVELPDRSEIDALAQRLTSHADPNVRAEAAKELYESERLEVIEPLIEALTDDDPQVRSTAASALGALARKLSEAKSDAVHLAGLRRGEALVRIKDALVASVADEDPAVVDSATEALAGLVPRKRFLEERDVSYEMNELARTIAPLVVERGDPAAIETLAKFARPLLAGKEGAYDRGPVLAQMNKAAGAMSPLLVERGDPAAVKTLAMFAEEFASRWAIDALGHIQDASAVQALVSLPVTGEFSDGNPETWLWNRGVAKALGTQGTPEAVRHLARALRLGVNQAFAAVHALSMVRGPAALQFAREDILAAAADPYTFGRHQSSDDWGRDDEVNAAIDKAWEALKQLVDGLGEQHATVAGPNAWYAEELKRGRKQLE